MKTTYLSEIKETDLMSNTSFGSIEKVGNTEIDIDEINDLCSSRVSSQHKSDITFALNSSSVKQGNKNKVLIILWLKMKYY